LNCQNQAIDHWFVDNATMCATPSVDDGTRADGIPARRTFGKAGKARSAPWRSAPFATVGRKVLAGLVWCHRQHRGDTGDDQWGAEDSRSLLCDEWV
jgi:hypothetical protein